MHKTNHTIFNKYTDSKRILSISFSNVISVISSYNTLKDSLSSLNSLTNN
jgi:hypothetical protein